jgi:PHD/YefM family antitoxin component YafN of YafNO toxin-antitoxin module
MPIVEDFPTIDPSVRHIGVSKLRGLNADKLRETEETFVIQDNDKPLAVLLTYDKFLAMQEKLKSVANVVDLLRNPAELAAIDAAFADVAANRLKSLDTITEELKKGRG